jgi:hypothetical protein
LIFTDRPADATFRSLKKSDDRHDVWLVSELGLDESGGFSGSMARSEKHIVRPFQSRDPIG